MQQRPQQCPQRYKILAAHTVVTDPTALAGPWRVSKKQRKSIFRYEVF